MNKVVRPITPDGMCGFDEHGQLVLWEPDPMGGHRGYMIKDVREKICRICGRGWVFTVESLRDQALWQSYEEYVHRSCLVRYGTLRERDLWTSILYGLRVPYRALKEIPNQYWGHDEWYSKRPWYKADLMKISADLTLGQRKRVYSVEIDAVGTDRLKGWEEAKKAFQDQQVTKEFSDAKIVVHAWTDIDAKDYLGRLARSLGFAREEDR